MSGMYSIYIRMYICLHIVPSKCDDIGAGFEVFNGCMKYMSYGYTYVCISDIHSYCHVAQYRNLKLGKYASL